MKAFFALFALPLVACMPSHPAPAYGHPAPAYGHPAPAYGHPAPAYGHPAPAYGHHQPAYGYEQPKHNCSVVDVVESADICTPTIAKTCADVELAIKLIVAVEQCYDVTRTVCTESITIIPNEVCSYSYEPKSEDTTGKTVEVAFNLESKTSMVTVCAPQAPAYGGYGGHHGGGYGGYGHQYCNEVAQTTQYNVPSVPIVEPPVTVVYPEPKKTCVDKPISLPVVACEDIVENKCIQVPAIEESSVSVAKCTYGLGEPACQKVELTLPKQVCVELVYGYAHEEKHHVPAEH
jgi:hypothetical protein